MKTKTAEQEWLEWWEHAGEATDEKFVSVLLWLSQQTGDWVPHAKSLTKELFEKGFVA